MDNDKRNLNGNVNENHNVNIDYSGRYNFKVYDDANYNSNDRVIIILISMPVIRN